MNPIERLENLLSVLHKREQSPEMVKRIESVKERIAKLKGINQTIADHPDIVILEVPKKSTKKKIKKMIEVEEDES